MVALGLTVLQARIYLALSRAEEANITTLSKTTNIARQEIYRVINELQNRGLAEKVIAKPVRYRAVQIKEAVPHLLFRINEEKIRVHKMAMGLLERHRTQKSKPVYHEKDGRFLLIGEKTLLSRRIRNAIEATRKSIKIVTPGRKFVPALFDLASSLLAALERGLTIKWLMNKRLNKDDPPKVLSQLLEIPRFKLRYVAEGALLTFGLYDNNTLIVASNPKLNYGQSQAVWTSAFPFLELANSYFDMLWVNSVEIEHKPEEYRSYIEEVKR